MDTYLLMLYVSIEQELAIRELFDCRGWAFKKNSESRGDSYQTNFVGEITTVTTSSSGTGVHTVIKTEGVADVGHPTSSNDSLSNKTHVLPSVNSTSYKYEQTEYVKDTNQEQPVNTIETDSIKTLDENQIYVGLKEFVQATIESHGSVEGNSNGEPEVEHVSDDSNLFTDTEDGVASTLDITNSYASDTDDNDETLMVNEGIVKFEEEKYKDSTLSEGVLEKEPPMKKKLFQTKARGQVTGNFTCNECKCVFKRKCAYDKHKQVHGQCLFVCEICGKEFTYKFYYNYQLHMRYHKKEAKYKCSICGRGFVERSNLKGHMRKHSGERPYVCEVCGQSYCTSTALSGHKRKHQEGPKIMEVFKCDICGLTLASKGGLKTHKADVHVTERLFACEICGKRFKTRRMLEEKHAATHRDEYPFACDFPGCKKRFKRTEPVQLHRRRHLNQRTLFCEQCGKGFYTKRDLTQHLRTHSGEKPFKCKFCDYRCAVSSNMAKHLKVHEGK